MSLTARAETAPETAPATPPADAPVAPASSEPEKVPFQYGFHGFIRAGYFYVPYNKDASPYVGHGSGFELPNSRLEFAGSYSHWADFKISIDNYPTIDASSSATVQTLAPIRLNFADAYVTGYLGAFSLRLGQFKAPFNGEYLSDDEFVPFTRRSAVTEGATAIESPYPFSGLSLGRQLGAMFGGKFMIGEKNSVKFDVAAINGNGINQGLNDNALPAVVGRVSATLGPAVLGLAGYWNARTRGVLATQQDETDIGADIDALLQFGALKFFLLGAVRQTSYATTGADPDLAAGGLVSASYVIDTPQVRWEPAARFSYFMPTTVTDRMAVMDTTIGINVGPRIFPARAQLNYTLRRHDASRQVPDDMVELVLQANF